MAQAAGPGTDPLVDDLAQRCRAGLGAAAAALYGRDAAGTAEALRQRAERGLGPWPWLPGLCYRALEPLGVAFAGDDRAMVVAGKAMVGRPVRSERVAEAARWLRQPEPVAPPQAPDPALAAAVDRFWARLTGLAQRLGQAARAGDDEAVDQLLQRARPALRDSAAEVHQAADAAARSPVRSEPEPLWWGRPDPTPPARDRDAPEPVEPPEPPPAAGVADPAGGVEPTRAAPHAEEYERGLGPDRPYAPVIFVGVALAIALLLLLVVAVAAG